MPVVILDRDGGINRDSPAFIKSPAEWLPLPGSLEAIARLTKAGIRVAIASNQSGVGRGLLDDRMLDRIHEKMLSAVRAAGGDIEIIEVCPHRPDAGCDCRKPRPGLLRTIASRMSIDLGGVPCVGDSVRDIEAAIAAGARPILVLTGNGRQARETLGRQGTAMPEVFENLSAASDELVREFGR